MAVADRHFERGSTWRRWDPHVHAPGTALNDQYERGEESFDDYIERLNSASPLTEVLGITDYCVTSCYEAVLAAQHDGRLTTPSLLFPNIELRLATGTAKNKGINIHILVSPEDPNHVDELNRFLSRLTFRRGGDTYACTPNDLVKLGKANDSSISDEADALSNGVNQFKVDFSQLRSRYEESDWARANILVGVAASSGDGTAGLAVDTSFTELRREIESFAHLIFSATPSTIAFWRGEGSASVEELVRVYGGRKACVHGSDAHAPEEVLAPDLDRRTWIKGDPSFDSLRQACMEPAARVHIGSAPPDSTGVGDAISHVRTQGLPWLLDGGIDLNSGLVAIIGSRGSGKTALADLIAHGAGSPTPRMLDESFVMRASQFVSDGAVHVQWANEEEVVQPLASPPSGEEAVHYLSQQFVERLCSSDGTTDELLREIEKVVFESHPAETRQEATDFEQLKQTRLGDTVLEEAHLRDRLDRLSTEAQEMRDRIRRRTTLTESQGRLQKQLKEDKEALDKIVRTGEEDRADYFERLRAAIERREQQLQVLGRRLKQVEHLAAEVVRYESQVLPSLADDLKKTFVDVGLTDAAWEAFTLTFVGDPKLVLAEERVALEADRKTLDSPEGGTVPATKLTPEQLDICSTASLRTAFEMLSKEIGLDRANATKMTSLTKRINATEIELQKLDRQLKQCDEASDRLKEIGSLRRSEYASFFDLKSREHRALDELYEPLAKRLAGSRSTVADLKLVVVRSVDARSWATRGERLLDLRKAGGFRGRGSLLAIADAELAPAWRNGSAADVAEAMEKFQRNFSQTILEASPYTRDDPEYGQWTLDIGRWLYSTDHVRVTYSFEFGGVPLSQLSPGTRGIVLLMLYLALDLDDHRPLIIDQPEENLDPQSVYDELVTLFRAARDRRQIFIVTHNANLVVNTDVDQVIVAECVRTGEGRPPQFSYECGGLENPAIRARVCAILEGGREAFRERARRLRLTDLD